MKRICVFCASSSGVRGVYAEATADLARLLVRRGIGIVYGGSNVGLMKTLADTALAEGGEVIGVIPRALVDKEVAHTGLADLRIVGSMMERKALMAELSDAFIALPGAYGTLDELFEMVTWTQLAFHRKPLGLLNVAGFYDHLNLFLDHAAREQLLRPIHRGLVLSADDAETLLERFARAEFPPVDKWIGPNAPP